MRHLVPIQDWVCAGARTLVRSSRLAQFTICKHPLTDSGQGRRLCRRTVRRTAAARQLVADTQLEVQDAAGEFRMRASGSARARRALPSASSSWRRRIRRISSCGDQRAATSAKPGGQWLVTWPPPRTLSHSARPGPAAASDVGVNWDRRSMSDIWFVDAAPARDLPARGVSRQRS